MFLLVGTSSCYSYYYFLFSWTMIIMYINLIYILYCMKFFIEVKRGWLDVKPFYIVKYTNHKMPEPDNLESPCDGWASSIY